MMAFICSQCKAEISITSLICEYCGYNMANEKNIATTDSDGFQLIKQANDYIVFLQLMHKKTYIVNGEEETILLNIQKHIRHIRQFCNDDKRAIALANELEKELNDINQVIKRLKNTARRKRITNGIFYFILVEVALFGIYLAQIIFSSENIDEFLMGILGGGGAILGAITYGIAGFFVAGIIGIGLANAIKYLLVTPIGNLLLIFIWQIIFIPIFIFKIDKKKGK